MSAEASLEETLRALVPDGEHGPVVTDYVNKVLGWNPRADAAVENVRVLIEALRRESGNRVGGAVDVGARQHKVPVLIPVSPARVVPGASPSGLGSPSNREGGTARDAIGLRIPVGRPRAAQTVDTSPAPRTAATAATPEPTRRRVIP
ncbi:MAG: hypothetical protein HOQ05_03125 [Corynebacteriales bacterium]|nr:hypothetical protein [Mycobacteriales bacterium]